MRADVGVSVHQFYQIRTLALRKDEMRNNAYLVH